MNDVFEELDRPAYPGQIREKSYRFLVPPEQGGGDMWMTRFQRYWERQERRFGIEFHPSMVIGVDRTNNVITCQVMVQRIRPGKRVPKLATHPTPLTVQ